MTWCYALSQVFLLVLVASLGKGVVVITVIEALVIMVIVASTAVMMALAGSPCIAGDVFVAMIDIR